MQTFNAQEFFNNHAPNYNFEKNAEELIKEGLSKNYIGQIALDLFYYIDPTNDQADDILKAYMQSLIAKLERGERVRVSGGYAHNDFINSLKDSHCKKIADKLCNLGYEYTSNHGHGCKDYEFKKAIEGWDAITT